MLLQCTQDYLLHATDFHFNIEKCLATIALQNIFQTGWQFLPGRAACLKLLERMRADDKMVELGVMTNDGSLVAGRADVKLKAIGAVLQRPVKRNQGVLGRVTARAPMSE